MAKYCATAVWEDERRAFFDSMRECGLLSPRRLTQYFGAWWYAIKDINLSSHFSVLQEVREIILWARCFGVVYGRSGTSSDVHCMVWGFMADRFRGRSQSCRWVDLTGAPHTHTQEVLYYNNQCRCHRSFETSCTKNYDVIRAYRMI